jgi:hypothetical protein
MTRAEAHALADRYIPNIWGSLRSAWVNGFINLPQLGVARYDRTSAAAKLRAMGVAARRHYEKAKAEAADGEDPHTAARERPQGSE